MDDGMKVTLHRALDWYFGERSGSGDGKGKEDDNRRFCENDDYLTKGGLYR